jgi:hypothetical protein
VGDKIKRKGELSARLKEPLMADVTLVVTLSDIEAHALAIIAASLGPEQFENAYQHWLNHWKATEAYSPQVEANMIDLTGEAAEKVYRALADAGFDVLTRLGPR